MSGVLYAECWMLPRGRLMLKLEDAKLSGMTVLVRVDFNVPIKDGVILDETRIEKSLPTINFLLENNCKIILISHMGRPSQYDDALSLSQVVPILQKLLPQTPIHFSPQIAGEAVSELVLKSRMREIILLENLRFYFGEECNDLEFAKNLAKLADFYVNDAFSCAHRAHASIDQLPRILPSAAGKLFTQEIVALDVVLCANQKPSIALIGGSKISTKITLLTGLLEKVDMMCVGGAMANSFLKSLGYNVGKSLYEPEFVAVAQHILELAALGSCDLVIPIDVVVAKKLGADQLGKIIDVGNIASDEMILDIGPKTVSLICDKITKSKSLLWNGPLGAFEYPPFDKGSRAVAQQIAKLTKENSLISVAGGGDTVSLLNTNKVTEDFTYVSTSGGAFLEYVEGKILPGIEALQ